ncbi:conserved hypothetical protein [Vibrio jasicida]|uniref:Uncharacterized protein n=2 Tax=Vibrionaceae TaxID=641 RepID=A0AAU9QR66_9VIBR|nr:conserved hypothetical protein [Vibrio jasicida]CAH1599554.1 conserved hypothetical protein [Vibrio jasicida]
MINVITWHCNITSLYVRVRVIRSGIMILQTFFDLSCNTHTRLIWAFRDSANGGWSSSLSGSITIPAILVSSTEVARFELACIHHIFVRHTLNYAGEGSKLNVVVSNDSAYKALLFALGREPENEPVASCLDQDATKRLAFYADFSKYVFPEAKVDNDSKQTPKNLPEKLRHKEHFSYSEIEQYRFIRLPSIRQTTTGSSVIFTKKGLEDFTKELSATNIKPKNVLKAISTAFMNSELVRETSDLVIRYSVSYGVYFVAAVDEASGGLSITSVYRR